MLPLRDDNPTRGFAWVNWALIMVNIAVFAWMVTLPEAELMAFVERFAFILPKFLASPGDATVAASALTSMFLHAGWLHLAGNMLYLWIFGNNIEDRLGPWRYLLFYLACGAVAIVAQSTLSPSATPLLGASGAIAGVLGAYLVLYPRATVLTVIPLFIFVELAALPAVFVIGFWFVVQLAQAVGSITPGAAGGVAWFAHVGGFVAGALAIVPAAARDAWSRGTRRTGY